MSENGHESDLDLESGILGKKISQFVETRGAVVGKRNRSLYEEENVKGNQSLRSRSQSQSRLQYQNQCLFVLHLYIRRSSRIIAISIMVCNLFALLRRRIANGCRLRKSSSNACSSTSSNNQTRALRLTISQKHV